MTSVSQMREELAQREVELLQDDAEALYQLLTDGCTGYDNMDEDEIREQYEEFFGEEDDSND